MSEPSARRQRDSRPGIFVNTSSELAESANLVHKIRANPPARTQAAQALEILSFAYTRCKKHFTRIVRRHSLTRQMRNAWPGSMDTTLGTCRTQHISSDHSCKQDFVSQLFAQLCRVTARGQCFCPFENVDAISVFQEPARQPGDRQGSNQDCRFLVD